MQIDETQLRTFIVAVLKDDNGISEKAHNELLMLIDGTKLERMEDAIDATDGRFYLPEDYEA